MTTLKNLKGTAIQFLAEDPVQYVGSWASGGSVNTARQYGAGIGSSTAGLIFGGSPSPAITEYYNGTAWTEVNDLGTGRYILAGAGTTSSALGFGGYTTARVGTTEEWTVPETNKTITVS